ncbi:MAG: hypothetical protein JO356_11700 [Acidobacteria bacterium]|nr:hypothetical protein [Acidobacteriota bacterium]
MAHLRTDYRHLLRTPFLAAIGMASLLLGTATGQTLTTSDSLLNTGSPTTTTYHAPGSSGINGPVPQASNSSNTLWLMYDNPWGVSSGSGTITQTYSGTGSFTTSINLSGLPGGGVDGYPFILYGCDPYSDCYNAQPPQFPKQLSSMSSLVVDFNYAFSGTIAGSDVDLLFDEWVCNTNHPTDTSQCLEVEILPYYSFIYFGGGTFIKTIDAPVTLNGATTTLSFDEYVGGTNVLFYPHTMPGLPSGQLRLNLLPLLTSGVTAFGNSSYQWLSGIELGTEFGANSTQSYTVTISKLDIEQTMGGTAPAPPTNLKAIVN